ncbi:MAG TPA: UDP-N-acetylmuramate--L-alanine ligase, partial [Candidatus Baltobacteraceae bacterium]|nr:UDP-N-acetylmuramate--L-alanine ligase [Candidatus Baltobacteraceae bacterium]
MRIADPVHFIGISGIGMSALARILLLRGYRVSGSSDHSGALVDQLIGEGARVAIGHVGANLGEAATVVVSSAIAQTNPELLEARARGLEIVRRGDFLAQLFNEKRGIAVAGTNGKTTTTAMIATVLEAAGLDPTITLGGERCDTGQNARIGNGAWFLTESDESDGSFLALRPCIAVVTNIENDHVSSDDELLGMITAFERFLASVPADGLALVGIDEPHAAALAGSKRAARTLSFGFSDGADVRASDIAHADFGTTFRVTVAGEVLGDFRLPVPGAINVLDSLPAIAIAHELKVPVAVTARALAAFGGVRRRFEWIAREPRMWVVDDYAHHPTAVIQTISAARANFSGPIVVAFQPHRYSRSQYLGSAFAAALSAADRVVLTDIYAASESPIPGIDTHSAIGEPLLVLGCRAEYVSSVDDLPDYLVSNVPEGALVLMLGAG